MKHENSNGAMRMRLTDSPGTPLRSWLFSPANHRRRVEKGIASAAHAVIIDLEDAVPLDEKVGARATLQAVLQQANRPNLFARINALFTPFAFDDIDAAIRPGLAGIILPKSEGPSDIQILDWAITQKEKRAGLPAASVEIVPLVESATGLDNIAGICGSSSRIKRVAFGAADFTLDLTISWSRDEQELQPYRSRLVLASRAAGLDAPIDTPWIHVQDREGMIASAERSKAHGFQGKLCIHPDQLDIVHAAYALRREQIEAAQRIVTAFEEAGSAAVKLDGKMIDYPVVEAARKTLLDAARTSSAAGENPKDGSEGGGSRLNRA